MARSGLGKGLGALIGSPAVATPKDGSDAGGRVHQIELTSIVPSTLQPRKDFARDVLLELADSQITYRQRYVMVAARAPVVDLVVLDPNNPRSVAYQLERFEAHLAALP